MKTTFYIQIACAHWLPGGAATILDPIRLTEKEAKTDFWPTGRIDIEITLDASLHLR